MAGGEDWAPNAQNEGLQGKDEDGGGGQLILWLTHTCRVGKEGHRGIMEPGKGKGRGRK